MNKILFCLPQSFLQNSGIMSLAKRQCTFSLVLVRTVWLTHRITIGAPSFSRLRRQNAGELSDPVCGRFEPLSLGHKPGFCALNTNGESAPKKSTQPEIKVWNKILFGYHS